MGTLDVASLDVGLPRMRTFRNSDIVVSQKSPLGLFQRHDRDIVGRLVLRLVGHCGRILADGIEVAIQGDLAELQEVPLGFEPLE